MKKQLVLNQLHINAKRPERKHDNDAGIDLTSSGIYTVYPFQNCLILTGYSVDLPSNTFGMECSRSGLALKENIIVLNSPGIIDEGYKGEIKVILYNLSKKIYEVNEGDRIAQLIIVSTNYYPIVYRGISTKLDPIENFSNVNKMDPNISNRGKSGFGSTGVL